MIRHNPTASAMLLMTVAMLTLPGIDAIAKWLAGPVSPGQITWSRFFFQALIMLPFALAIREPWKTTRLWHQSARGALLAAATLCFFTGLQWLPMADAIAIFFIEPLLVTLLSALFLGEALRWRRMTAIAVGFVGALIIIRPTFADVGPAALFPVGAALCFSFYILLTRMLVADDNPIRLQFLTGIFGCAVMSVALAFGEAVDFPTLAPAWPTLEQWLLLAALGAIASFSHLIVVYAYRLASIGILAPFQYVEIIGATTLGFLVFGDFPDPVTWLGIAIIVGSGVYVFHRESALGLRDAEIEAEAEATR